MKRLLAIAAFVAFTLPAAAQHDDHDHEGHSHGGGSHSLRGTMEAAQAIIDAGAGGRTVSHSFVGVAPRAGLAWQKGWFAEAGLSLDFYRIGYVEHSEYVTFSYLNLRPYLSGEILIDRRKLLGGGKAGVEFIMSTPIVGMAFGADAAYYSDGRADAITITPRLVLSLVYVEVFYGYNFFVRNDLHRWIGHHRAGVSATLDWGFWRRKKEIYEDYYNSYL